MTIPTSRRVAAPLAVALICLTLLACGGSSLDGVYHSPTGGPISITLKNGQATVQVATESKTLPFKVDGKKITIIDPKEGDLVLTINDDGTLNSQLGLLTKKSM